MLALAFAGLFIHQRGGRRRPADGAARRRDPARRRTGAGRGGAGGAGCKPGCAAGGASARSSRSGSPGRTSCATSPGSCPANVFLQSLNATSPTLTASVRATAAAPATPGGRTDRLHGHRLRRLAGSRRAGPRPAGSAPLAHRRDAPVERPRYRREHAPVQFTIAATLSSDRRSMMIERLNGRAAVGLAAAGLLLVLLVGWFGVVSPQRSKAAELAAQIERRPRAQLAATQALIDGPVLRQSTAELATLRTAIPDERADVADPAPALEGLRASPGCGSSGSRRSPSSPSAWRDVVADERRGRRALLRDPRVPPAPARAGPMSGATTRCVPPGGSSRSTRSSSPAW